MDPLESALAEWFRSLQRSTGEGHDRLGCGDLDRYVVGRLGMRVPSVVRARAGS